MSTINWGNYVKCLIHMPICGWCRKHIYYILYYGNKISCISCNRRRILMGTCQQWFWLPITVTKGGKYYYIELGDRVDNIDSLRVKDTQRFSSAALKDTIMKRGVLCYPPLDSDHVLYPRTYSLFPQITRTSSGTSHSQESPWKQNETNTEGSFTY